MIRRPPRSTPTPSSAASDVYKRQEEEDNIESLTDLNLEDENIQKLSNKGIKNKDDLAELSIDELKDIIDISNDEASSMIMKAREHWFK